VRFRMSDPYHFGERYPADSTETNIGIRNGHFFDFSTYT
jgi:hypothetical protein